jgi:hypothetical protein
MTDQYLRACSLIVGAASGEGLDLSELHIRFQVNNGDTETPNNALIRVYNLAPDTARRIQKEFTRVVLSAGYQDNAGVIFSGQIKQVIRGRESATDTFIDIIAADGDQAYNFARISQSFAAGYTPTMQLDALLKAMQPYGVTRGNIAALPDIKAPRGCVLAGPVKQFLSELADTFGLSWSIVFGELQMVPVNGILDGDTIELTANTGLVGMPQQTIDGIMVKCLLNPRIRPCRQIRLNNGSVQELAISPGYKYRDVRPAIDADGLFKVWAVNHSGDTRGNVWHSDLVCSAATGMQPFSPTFIAQGIYGS